MHFERIKQTNGPTIHVKRRPASAFRALVIGARRRRFPAERGVAAVDGNDLVDDGQLDDNSVPEQAIRLTLACTLSNASHSREPRVFPCPCACVHGNGRLASLPLCAINFDQTFITAPRDSLGERAQNGTDWLTYRQGFGDVDVRVGHLDRPCAHSQTPFSLPILNS